MDSVFGLGSEILGIESEKQSKVAFFQKFFQEKPTKPNFLKNYSYLFWVLRNLPHKFEKLAHVTKSAKKTSPYEHLAKLEPQSVKILLRSGAKAISPGQHIYKP